MKKPALIFQLTSRRCEADSDEWVTIGTVELVAPEGETLFRANDATVDIPGRPTLFVSAAYTASNNALTLTVVEHAGPRLIQRAMLAANFSASGTLGFALDADNYVQVYLVDLARQSKLSPI